MPDAQPPLYLPDGSMRVKPSRTRWSAFQWTLLMLWVSVLLMHGAEWWMSAHHHDPSPDHTVWTTGATVLTATSHRVDNPTARPETDPKVIRVMNESLRKWEKVLHRTIRRPTLMRGSELDCLSGEALACANPVTWSICLTGLVNEENLPHVMLHEIAHLLGVPHIEGDVLMDARYSVPVDQPTPFAVALAQAAK